MKLVFAFLSNVSFDLFEIVKTVSSACVLLTLAYCIIAEAPFEKSVFLARVGCVAQT